jgi:L-alanine-DL-glutamate epimerase-like enolase superfamily enzyme
MKGGQGPETDFAALAEIRRAIGDSIDIYVDVNQYYDRKTSLRYVREMAGRGVKLVEDPYPLQPDEEFRAFQEQCPIPILVDTHCTASADARAFLAHGAQAISLKPGRLGLTEARRCARIADDHRAHTVVGLFAESDIGTLNSAQLASTRAIDGGGLPAEISFFLMMRESLLAAPLQADNGILLLPDRPSIAELVDWSKVERLQLN